MYHDEKLTNGILHWRGTPTGEWMPFTLKQLSERVMKAESERDVARATLIARTGVIE